MSEQAGKRIDAVERLFASIGIPRTITDLGVTQAHLEVAEQGSARPITKNPRTIELGLLRWPECGK